MATSYDKQTVTYVQTTLNKQNPSPNLIVDGIYGNNTKEAIKQYQLKNNLLPTGMIDTDLLKSLGGTTPTTSSSNFIATHGKKLAISASVVAFVYGIYFINKLRKKS